MRIHFVVVIAISACASAPRPTTSLSANQTYVVGEPIAITAGWNAQCLDVIETLASGFSKTNPGPTTRSYSSCHAKPFQADATCSMACDIEQHATADGAIDIVVRPRSIGPLTITLRMTRNDNQERSEHTYDHLWVTAPDRLELACPRPEVAAMPCGPDGVSANAPVVKPLVYLHGIAVDTDELRVNGRPLPASAHELSLVDLFPAAASGFGIAPGTYAVTLGVGATTSSWQVVAR